MTMHQGVVVFERTDGFTAGVGNQFDTDPMVYLTEPSDSWNIARGNAGRKARELIESGMANLLRMGYLTDSMREAAHRITVTNNATYSFELPDGSRGEFLVRIVVADSRY